MDVEPELGSVFTRMRSSSTAVVVVVVVRIARPAETHLDSLPLRIQLPRQEEVVRRRWVVGVSAMPSAGVGDAVQQVRRISMFIATVPLEELVVEVESCLGRVIQLVEPYSRTRWLRKWYSGVRVHRIADWCLHGCCCCWWCSSCARWSRNRVVQRNQHTKCNSDRANVVQNEERGTRATTTQKN